MLYDPVSYTHLDVYKRQGDAEALSGERIRTVPLLGGYAVVNLPEEEIQEFASRPQIEFVEIPKRLYFQVNQALDAACIRPVQELSLIHI